MVDLLVAVIASLFRAFRSRRDLVLENLALRHRLDAVAIAKKKARCRDASTICCGVHAAVGKSVTLK
jgi:hypothetical protein